MEYIENLLESINKTEIISGNAKQHYKYRDAFVILLDEFTKHKSQNSQMFFIGNGGSSAIASHMTADFMKNGGMKTYSLYDNAMLTCMGNDYGYEYIFSKPLEYLLRSDDLLIAISSSGNSNNIINAINVAKSKGSTVITFTGFQANNRVKQMGDINVYVPCSKYGMVESIHNLILQQIVDEIMERDGVTI